MFEAAASLYHAGAVLGLPVRWPGEIPQNSGVKIKEINLANRK
jgi:hypothetical protein